MPGDVEEVYAAVRETDFLATVSESPVVASCSASGRSASGPSAS